MRNCLDEGMLQSYMDGELSPELTAGAAAHVAACAACAGALDAARAELSLFAAAFAPDASLSVPSESLRERLDAAIAGMESSRPAPRGGTFWNLGSLAAWLAAPFNFEPRAAGAFASLLALVALAAVLGSVYFGGGKHQQQQPVSVAENTPVEKTRPSAVAPVETAQPNVENTPTVATENDGPVAASRGVVANARNASQPRRGSVARIANSRGEPKSSGGEVETPAETASAQQSVPGEENYLKTIASLSKVVEVGGADALRPQFRIAYERNLAVIDKAIEETRRAALRDPKDADTTSFLFSAYQNKIDLLSTAADQAQVATLGR